MPELPEVQTIINDLSTKVRNRTFVDIWTDWSKIIKKPDSFDEFKKGVIGEKILNLRRRGKNIIVDLSDNKSILIHQKMTGHLLYGRWKFDHGWKSEISGVLQTDPVNGYLHLVFFFDNGYQLALSDLRKFAKVELWDTDELAESEYIKKLGPEPLEKTFTFEKFRKALPPKGKIKQVLMDQSVIAGIGNIYSDEILWVAKIHPLKDVAKLTNPELRKIYSAILKILNKGLKYKGDSMSDYRLPDGEKGGYQNVQLVYQKEGKPCPNKNCGIVKRLKIGGRSAHFCPVCQKL